MKVRFLPTLALGAALATAGCTDPYGRTDWGRTLALGAGVGLAAGALAAVASDGGHRRQPSYRDGGSYRGGYGRSYAGGYGGRRGW